MVHVLVGAVPVTRRKSTEISAREVPRQARSTRLVTDTVEAAVRILTRDGAQRFTTARVAEEAGMMRDHTRDPTARQPVLVVAFFGSEWDEAALRRALGGAAPAYRDAPEVAAQRRSGGERIMGLMSATGKQVSESAGSTAEVDSWDVAVGDMLCGCLRTQA
jgi:hypothetical protein